MAKGCCNQIDRIWVAEHLLSKRQGWLGNLRYVRLEAASEGVSASGYFRHTDNSSGNGRLLTALVYFNENWQQGDGGELRLFYPGAPVVV